MEEMRLGARVLGIGIGIRKCPTLIKVFFVLCVSL